MNKLFILALLACVSFSTVLYSEHQLTTMFQTWKLKYNKNFASNDLEAYRFQVFVANVYTIELLKQDSPDTTFGLTQFADLTEEEFIALYTGYNPTIGRASQPNNVYVFNGNVNDLPTEVDWTEKGAVTHVKNQGSCGSCWAFSTTGNLEGQNFLVNGDNTPLSEQELVDCDTIDQGCNGGLMDNAFTWLKENGGITSEDSYPYRGIRQKCHYDPATKIITPTGYTDIPKADEATQQERIANYGPVSVAIHAGSGLQLYAGGIYNPVICSQQLNHGVLGVGYGTKDGKDFWKIKNSWGSGWGEKGYFRIIRGKNKCGIASQSSYAHL